MSSTRSCIGGYVLMLLLATSTALAAGGKNLVDNPSFGKKKAGEEIHRWTIQTREGRTRFAVEQGVLVAERTARTGILPDSCYQWINLPSDAKALRFRVRAGTEEAGRVEIVVRFKDQDGAPLESVVVFSLKGTREMREYERDLLIPAGAWDVEIAFVMRGAGKARFDDVSLTAIDTVETREEASVVTVSGSAWVKWVGTRPEEAIRLYLPVPPATGSQTPIRLDVKTFPNGRIKAAAFDVTRGTGRLRLSIDPLEQPDILRIFWKMRIVVYERPVFRTLPDALPTAPGGRISRKLLPFVAVESGPGLKDLGPRLDLGKGDLRSLTDRIALVLSRHIRSAADGPTEPEAVAAKKRGCAVGRANLASALLRTKGVPARTLALVTTGKGSGLEYAYEAWHRDQGWLRFGTGSSDPRPLPFASAVVIGVADAKGWPAPLAPEVPAGTEGGPGPAGGVFDGEGAFRIESIGTFTLPKGSVDEFAESAGKAWEKALRRTKVDLGSARAVMVSPELKGRAKNAKDDLVGWIEK